MTALRFRIAFATPFRVSSGEGAPGVDATIDASEPLPASSLKGVMKATARDLDVSEKLLAEVFGSPQRASPWQWSSAAPIDGWSPLRPAARVALDEHHGATHDMLAVAEQTLAGAAEFTITRAGSCATDGRDEDDARRVHVAVLAVAGQATRSLGAARRRGLGWVQIRCLDPIVTDDHVATVLGSRS